jgi:hypothetical protein
VDVDVGKEVLPHEGMVRFGMVARNTDVLVHIKCDDIFEGDLKTEAVSIPLASFHAILQ